MGDGVKSDSAQLQQMAAALRNSTSEVDGLARSVPPMPEVTTSGERVSFTVGELMNATGALIAGVHETADKIGASDGSYGEVDNHGAGEFHVTESKFTR